MSLWLRANGLSIFGALVIVAGVVVFLITTNALIAIMLLVLGGLCILPAIVGRTPALGRGSQRAGLVPLILLAGLLVIALAYGLTREDILPNTAEIQIGAVILLGVSLLLVLLFITAAGFAILRLADPSQALGLPEGSVRALIALFLVLIFVIMGLYLFRAVAFGSTYTVSDLTAYQTSQIPAERVVASRTSAMTVPTYDVVYQIPGNSITSTVTITLTGVTPDQIAALSDDAVIVSQNLIGTAQTYDVLVRTEITEAGADIGQQLLTTVGTLVVAVAGFYFGTRAVAVARGAAEAAKPVNIANVSPESEPAGKDKHEVELTIHGKNIRLAPDPPPNTIVLTQATGNRRIEAPPDKITFSAKEIRCKITISPDDVGTWTIIVTDEDGKQHETTNQFEVTVAQTQPSESSNLT